MKGAMKSIVLPAGTEHVQFGELVHLIADALWPDAGPDDDSMTNTFAYINLDAELARAVDSGALPVKDPLTLGPHTYPVGYALKTALVTVDDLQRFVSDRGLSVIVETPETQAADAPAEKVEAGADTSPSGGDWKVQARVIADECFDHDTNATPTVRDSLATKNTVGHITGGYCFRVMVLMQERGIKGPRGIITNPATIMRDALQGKKWWANKTK
ncbi:MAG: hypothetical protein Q8L69_00570 [Gallionellaceae bacterium]|nr:hypothetical protein [Gallionellaceae bacterium]